MIQDRYKYFRIEARELLDDLGKGVLDLEKGKAEPEAVARMLRLAHTLKGAARVVKQPEIADLSHAIEDLLAPMRDGAALPQERADQVLAHLDAIAARVATLGAPEAPVDKPVDEPVSMVRADVEEMDALLDGIGEVRVQFASLERVLGALDRVRRLTELFASELASPRAQRQGAAPKVRSMIDEISRLVSQLDQNASLALGQVDRELRQVRDLAERLRLAPAGTLFNALERSARDAAQSQNKRVTFDTKGGDVRIDAHVLAIVQPALVQAVRNAVAHGIESETERRAAKKPPEGRISLLVARRGNRVAFVCRDDGRGVDLDAVRRAAERKGALPAGADRLGAEELVQLMLQGGISTAASVTEVSGRGIGLDVVREATSRLGGEVSVHTERNVGTTIEIVVPGSLSSLDALIVEAAGQVAAIPLDAVRRTLRVSAGEVARGADGSSIVYEGKVIPFAPLARSLRAKASHARAWSAVVVEGSRALAAVGVDRLRGAQNVVLRPLPRLTIADPVVLGASFDADGSPQIVLDPERLVADARVSETVEAAQADGRLPLLIIDDSMTTRMLEQSILEAAGYEVEVAASGEEALDMARRKQFGLFLVDVEMPGMDGFTFIERARSDPAIERVPSILVTSRTAPQDKARGEAVGAAAYIVKSEFDQMDLVDRIRRLVG